MLGKGGKILQNIPLARTISILIPSIKPRTHSLRYKDGSAVLVSWSPSLPNDRPIDIPAHPSNHLVLVDWFPGFLVLWLSGFFPLLCIDNDRPPLLNLFQWGKSSITVFPCSYSQDSTTDDDYHPGSQAGITWLRHGWCHSIRFRVAAVRV